MWTQQELGSSDVTCPFAVRSSYMTCVRSSHLKSYCWWYRGKVFCTPNAVWISTCAVKIGPGRSTSSYSSYMLVSWNRGTPKSSIPMGFSMKNQPFWIPPMMETSTYLNTHRTVPSVRNHCYEASLKNASVRGELARLQVGTHCACWKSMTLWETPEWTSVCHLMTDGNMNHQWNVISNIQQHISKFAILLGLRNGCGKYIPHLSQNGARGWSYKIRTQLLIPLTLW